VGGARDPPTRQVGGRTTATDLPVPCVRAVRGGISADLFLFPPRISLAFSLLVWLETGDLCLPAERKGSLDPRNVMLSEDLVGDLRIAGDWVGHCHAISTTASPSF